MSVVTLYVPRDSAALAVGADEVADTLQAECARRGDAVRIVRNGSRGMQPGVVYTTFHFPESGANVITTDNSDWATNCPEYKVTAVQVMPVAQLSTWQRDYAEFNTQQLGLLAQAAEAVER